MKIEKFGKKEGDNVIENSNIHPNLNETILDSAESWNGSYEFESDFMFGFIQSLIAKGYCDDVSEEDDFEVMCYKWCIKYFAKYFLCSAPSRLPSFLKYIIRSLWQRIQR